jgi:ribosomal protein S18 acetylase RimI-like enzyme
MRIRSLDGVSWDDLARAFNEAFSDYAVSTVMTAESLANMQYRRGYVAGLSFGAYDGARLIGFVLTCVDGDRTYNSGTGIVSSHRRTGIARALLDTVLANTQARAYVLEVLENNSRAIALYTSAGFVETRRLACWTYDRQGEQLPELPTPDLAAIAARADVELSWQNSVASLQRAREPYVVLGDDAGAALVFPGSADLPLLVVAHDARRRGRGTRLLAAAAARASRPLRILNIDDRATHIADFLTAAGAVLLARQIEMVRRS